jgi:Beta-propeller repeat
MKRIVLFLLSLAACTPPASTLPVPTLTLITSSETVRRPGKVKLEAVLHDLVATRVDFFEGTTLLGNDSSDPFSQDVNFTLANNGPHTYTAKAIDANGRSVSSEPVQVTVNIPSGLPAGGFRFGSASTDIPRDITVDAQGNIIVVGSTYAALEGNTHAGDGDAFVAKFSRYGDRLWIKQLGATTIRGKPNNSIGDDANAVHVDTNGNIFITGSTGGDLEGEVSARGGGLFVMKLNPNGIVQWTTLIASPNFPDGPFFGETGLDIDLDGSGNVFLAGYTIGPLDGVFAAGRALQDVVMIKLDPNGKQVWLRQVGGLSNDYARSVVVDAQGNSYAVGDTPGGMTDTSDVSKRQQYLVIKFDPDGLELWRKELGDVASYGKHGVDFGEAAGMDANGFLYISGFTTSSTLDPAFPTEPFISKLNPNGEVLWTKRFADPNGSAVDNIAVDPLGNVFVAGNTYGTPSTPGSVFVTKYDTAGSRVWSSQRTQINKEVVFGVALNAAGQIFITGADGDPFVAPSSQVYVQELDALGVRR